MARLVLAVLMLACLAPAAAQESARLALLIGNTGYSEKVGPLKNPLNDVALVEAALTALGFKVTTVPNATYKSMDTALKRYVRQLDRAGPGAIGFFYYSGHGVSNPETKINYLVPVDVSSADDETLWDEAFQQNAVIDMLSGQARKATHFVVFDACRNELRLSGPASKALGDDKGFVPVQTMPGLLIAYATAPGRTATDVGEDGGPYAKALAAELVKPGVEAVSMFRRVQISVKQAIGQDPWLSFPSLPEIYLAGRTMEPAPDDKASLSEAAQAWARIEGSTNPAVLDAYARQFPGTVYAALAQQQIDKLKEQVAAVAPPPAPPVPLLVQPAVGVFAPATRPGETFRDCPACPEMVVVPAGSFMMGSPESEEGRSSDEGPQRTVTIRQPFAVGKYEVTFAEWDACVAAGGCKHKPDDEYWGRGKRPAINVSWDDAKEYVSWLSKKTGQTYRLLSEAEWEYAARAGTTGPFSTGATIMTDQANFDGNGTYGGSAKGIDRIETVEVGSFKANAYGLYDVHGNVWEGVEDCYHANYNGAPSDGSAWTTGDCRKTDDGKDVYRVVRGGSWSDFPELVRSASRIRGQPNDRTVIVGFRVGRTFAAVEAVAPKGAEDQAPAGAAQKETVAAKPTGCTPFGKATRSPVTVSVGAQLCSENANRATIHDITSYSITYSVDGGQHVTCKTWETCTFAWSQAPTFKVRITKAGSGGPPSADIAPN